MYVPGSKESRQIGTEVFFLFSFLSHGWMLSFRDRISFKFSESFENTIAIKTAKA